MKTTLHVVIILFFTGFVSGCNVSNQDAAEATFTGTIEHINEDQARVAIEEGDILRSGDKVMVDLSVADDVTLQVGDRIRVGYDGGVQESHPLGINTTFVERVEN